MAPTPNSALDLALPLIREAEGLKLSAYLCPADRWTIGYGHTGNVLAGDTISRDDAEMLLRADAADALADVQRLVRVPLLPSQAAALISFVFNLGAGNFQSSTMLRELNAGNYLRVATELPRWNKGTVKGKKQVLPGLVTRRAAEVAMWRRRA